MLCTELSHRLRPSSNNVAEHVASQLAYFAVQVCRAALIAYQFQLI